MSDETVDVQAALEAMALLLRPARLSARA